MTQPTRFIARNGAQFVYLTDMPTYSRMVLYSRDGSSFYEVSIDRFVGVDLYHEVNISLYYYSDQLVFDGRLEREDDALILFGATNEYDARMVPFAKSDIPFDPEAETIIRLDDERVPVVLGQDRHGTYYYISCTVTTPGRSTYRFYTGPLGTLTEVPITSTGTNAFDETWYITTATGDVLTLPFQPLNSSDSGLRNDDEIINILDHDMFYIEEDASGAVKLTTEDDLLD